MRTITIAAAATFALAALPARAAAQDYDAMAKWTDAKVIRFHVSGDFTGSGRITGGQGAAMAKVITDRVEFDFEWNNVDMKLLGAPTFKNFPTKVASVEPGTWRGMKCPPAKIEGAFEYVTLQSVTGRSMLLELKGQRDWPAGSVPYGAESSTGFCGQHWESVKPSSDPVTIEFDVPQAMMLEMPEMMAGTRMKVSKDKKSFIADKNDGWVWTLTPTIVK